MSDIRVIDVDTHLTEPHDLWTSRAPAEYRDRVPQVRDIDGDATWVLDGTVLGRAGAGGVVARDGSKTYGPGFFDWRIDDVHEGAVFVEPRLALMDQLGIWGQVMYPNIVGFGGHRFERLADTDLRSICVTIFNDAMAEIQDESGQRIFPMGLLPWWDPREMVVEAERIKGLGLKGVTTTSDPQSVGLPDLADRHWDPAWEACSDLGLPVNFHVGASETSRSWLDAGAWPSFGIEGGLVLGGSLLFMSNARIVANLLVSGLLERFPTLHFVSVESGIGWVPYVLEALDYMLVESAPTEMEYLTMKPSEYFRRQMSACFWFESTNLATLIPQVGEDCVMFETDFPHPTCLYPDSLTEVKKALDGVDPAVQRKVLSGNAARVYGIEVPA